MGASLADVLNEPTDWFGIAARPYYFAATIAGVPCELRLNDFPDENIATLWIRGERHELEEFPQCWRLPRHRVNSEKSAAPPGLTRPPSEQGV